MLRWRSRQAPQKGRVAATTEIAGNAQTCARREARACSSPLVPPASSARCATPKSLCVRVHCQYTFDVLGGRHRHRFRRHSAYRGCSQPFGERETAAPWLLQARPRRLHKTAHERPQHVRLYGRKLDALLPRQHRCRRVHRRHLHCVPVHLFREQRPQPPDHATVCRDLQRCPRHDPFHAPSQRHEQHSPLPTPRARFARAYHHVGQHVANLAEELRLLSLQALEDGGARHRGHIATCRLVVHAPPHQQHNIPLPSIRESECWGVGRRHAWMRHSLLSALEQGQRPPGRCQRQQGHGGPGRAQANPGATRGAPSSLPPAASTVIGSVIYAWHTSARGVVGAGPGQAW